MKRSGQTQGRDGIARWMALRQIYVAIALSLCLTGIPTLVVGQTWNLHVVDGSGTWGFGSRIVTTSDETPYTLYASSSTYGQLRLAWWVAATDSTGGWSYYGVTSAAYPSFGFAVDAGDSLHVAYSNGSSIYYGVFDTATKSWSQAPAAIANTSGASGVDLALYETSTATVPGIVAYVGATARFVTRDSLTQQWSATPEIVENVLPVGSIPSIAVDSGGSFHVVFYENGGQNLRYAKRVGGSWIGEYVDTAGTVGEYHSIRIDENDVIHIVYYDGSNQDLKYATLAP